MSTKDTLVSPEQELSIEKLRHLEAYFREREQEDALREDRIRRAGRIHQIDAALSAMRGELVQAAQPAKPAQPKGDA